MTIKQLGGVFGRNPTFEDVTIEGTLTFDGDIDINSDLRVDGDLDVNGTVTADRASSDGTCIDIQKDGVSLGTLGASVGDLFIQGKLSGHSGLRFDSSAIIPFRDNSISSNTTDLGLSNVRFKDIYLGGNVVVTSGQGIDFSATSGTGTSELFDDYEEGTFTAAISTGSGSATLKSTHQTGRYTKVGRLVHVCGYLQVDTVSTPGGFGTITGLPFTVANNNASYVGGGLWINGFLSFTGAPSYLVYTNTTDFSMRRITGGSASDDMGAYLQANSSIMFNITYTTEA